jgi:hypothetical protein
MDQKMKLDLEFFDGVAVLTEDSLLQHVNPRGLLGDVIHNYVDGDTSPGKIYSIVLEFREDSD